jgi:hypothetical protein
MKYLKIAFGLALVAGLMAVAAAPAMAAPRWVHCVKVKTAGTGQWNNANCSEIDKTNEYETKAITETSEVTSSGKLTRTDTDTIEGEVKIECEESNRGWVVNLGTGPGEGGIISISAINCKTLKGTCEKPNGSARNLPWGIRLVEVAGKEEVRDELISGPRKEEGEGQPGYAVECTVGGIIKVIDRCERSGTTQNVLNNRVTGATAFVFEAKAGENANCSEAKEKARETGTVLGTVTEKLRALTSLWVLAQNLPNSK